MALIVGLALAGGGYELAPRHIAGLGVWLVVVALLVLGAAGRASLGRPLYLTVALLAAISLLSALSSLWSGSVELSVIEMDRVLVYLGLFLAAFLIAQTDQRRQRFAEGLALAIVAIAILGLVSRLLPNALDIGNNIADGPQLRYPLGYWNANGVAIGIGVALLLWGSRHATATVVRWLAAAAIPLMLLTLYLTYSRGGVLALLLASGCTIALSRDRLWLLATLGAGALGALPAVIAVQDNRAVADNVPGQAAVDQGATVFAILLAGIALAVLLFAALRWMERRRGGLTGRAVALSRDPKLLRGIAVVAAVAAIGALVAVGGRTWDRFTDSEVQAPGQPEQHFTDLSGAGRADFYRVAIDGFEEEPLRGAGAGTYEFVWEQHRSITQPVHDAHSVYLEAFTELGLVGGLLVLALFGGLLWIGFSAWRAAPHPQRELCAVLLAAMLAFAVGAGLDWFWEIAGLGAIFFLAAGVLVAIRCEQTAPLYPPSDTAADEEAGGRFGVTVAGLAIAWVAAVALIGPLLVDRELAASESAADRGNFASAVDHAETARSIEPFAASPYLQLALLAAAENDYATAAQRLTQAIDREDRNWQLYYLRSKVEESAGNAAGARSDLEHARRLNPRAPELQAGER